MVGGASKFRCSRINDSLADDDGITADRRRDKLPVLRRHCQPVKALAAHLGALLRHEHGLGMVELTGDSPDDPFSRR